MHLFLDHWFKLPVGGKEWSWKQSKDFAGAPDFASTISYHFTEREFVKAEHLLALCLEQFAYS